MFYGYAALLVFSTNVAVFLHRDMELVSILKEDLRVMEELNTHQQAINGTWINKSTDLPPRTGHPGDLTHPHLLVGDRQNWLRIHHSVVTGNQLTPGDSSFREQHIPTYGNYEGQ